jgi:hypothetical protein
LITNHPVITPSHKLRLFERAQDRATRERFLQTFTQGAGSSRGLSMCSSRPLMHDLLARLTVTLRRIEFQKFRAILNINTSGNANDTLFAISRREEGEVLGWRRLTNLAPSTNCHLHGCASSLKFRR